MTRVVTIGLAIVLLLGIVGTVRLSGGGVASQLAAVAGVDLTDGDSASSAEATATPVPVVVRVRVRDPLGRAVADAPIEVQDRFGRALVQNLSTDTRGEVQFAVPPTEGASIRSRKAGVGQARVSLNIARPVAGQTAPDIDLVLTAAAPPNALPSPTPAGQGQREGDGGRGQPTPTAAPPARPAPPRRIFVGHLQPRITTIDVASATAAGPAIDLGGGRITHIVAAQSGRRLFASWGGSTEVVRLRTWDLGEEGRLTLNAGTVASLATNPADGHLWVATAGAEGQEYSNVIEVDADGVRILRRLEFNRRTGAIRFTDDGATMAVAHRSTSEVSLIDVATGTTTKLVRLPTWAGDYQFINDGATLLVGNQSTSVVYAVDRATGEVRRMFDVGSGVSGIATIPGTNRFLAANGQLGLVQSIDATSGEVRDVVPVGQQPQMILVTDDGRRAYVANAASASVSVIDLTTMAVTDTIPAGNGASALAITPAAPAVSNSQR